jgi:staphylococcal nuclease domain-containing protein 1
MASQDQPGAGFLQARVKSVLSGDTVILTKLEDPRKERTLSLAYVTAPRLKREGDEVRETILWSYV